jgi:hypothetical protein
VTPETAVTDAETASSGPRIFLTVVNRVPCSVWSTRFSTRYSTREDRSQETFLLYQLTFSLFVSHLHNRKRHRRTFCTKTFSVYSTIKYLWMKNSLRQSVRASGLNDLQLCQQEILSIRRWNGVGEDVTDCRGCEFVSNGTQLGIPGSDYCTAFHIDTLVSRIPCLDRSQCCYISGFSRRPNASPRAWICVRMWSNNQSFLKECVTTPEMMICDDSPELAVIPREVLVVDEAQSTSSQKSQFQTRSMSQKR